MDRTAQTFRLDSGRKIGFAEFGSKHGTAVIHCHGSSSSRLEHPPANVDLETLGVRFVTIDRPGHGLSDYKPSFGPLDGARDVRKLAEHLGLRQFILTGWSVGGAHALACAHQIPERVAAVGLISSFAPMDRPDAMEGVSAQNARILTLAERAPWLIKLGMGMQGWATRKNPGGMIRRLSRQVSQPDREVLARQDCLDVLVPAMQEAYRQGSRGPAAEATRKMHSWGFAVQEIRVPVHMWHGEDDQTVPREAAHYLARSIPDAEAVYLPDAGHFFVFRRWPEILEVLLDVARAQATR